MYITIDRFEGDFAVIETEQGEIYNIPRALISDAEEGDVINIFVDKQRTKNNADNIEILIDELFN